VESWNVRPAPSTTRSAEFGHAVARWARLSLEDLHPLDAQVSEIDHRAPRLPGDEHR